MIGFLNNLLTLSLEAAPWLVLGLVIGGLMKALIPISFLEKHLSGSGVPSIVKAALLGAPLPLCSCGVIPAALGLRRAGASKPATISFLVSTPETGVDSISISYALLGPFMAIVRPIAAIVSAITAGLLVGRSEENSDLNREAHAVAKSSCCSSQKEPAQKAETSSCCSAPAKEEVKAENVCCASKAPVKEEPVISCCSQKKPKEEVTSCCSSKEAPQAEPESGGCCGSSESKPAIESKSHLQEAWEGIVYSFTDLFDKVLFWLVIGLIFAALIKTFVPVTFLAEWGSGLPAMLVMLVVGIPMYVCATASTPIAAGLLLAGVSPGTAMVYLMAGPATNISTLGVIGKELGRRALFAYLSGVCFIALATGFLVDYLIVALDIDVQAQISHSHEMVPATIAWLSLLILIGVAVKLKLRNIFK